MDELEAERLPGLATQLLVDGVDNPALRQLAGLINPSYWEAAPLFERLLADSNGAADSTELSSKG
jgi:hypothetical protein